MTIDIWLYYLIAVLILTSSPGPSSLLCMTKGVTGGWQTGAQTALGSLTAITIIMTLSFGGLGVLVTSSETLFSIIKWLGAAYLIYLGIKALTSSEHSYQSATDERTANKGFKGNYVSGFLVGASNPKAILFFTALFPQFINPAANLLSQYTVFAVTFMTLELAWLLFYAYLGAKSSNWILSSGRAKLFNRLSGGVFIGAGAFIAHDSKNI